MVALGEGPRDTFVGGEPFVSERLREPAVAEPPPSGGQTVGRNEPGRLEEVGDQLRDLVHLPPGPGGARLAPGACVDGSGSTAAVDSDVPTVGTLRHPRSLISPDCGTFGSRVN